ncbi:serine hydrolase domain-containing protein [Paenibacillus tianjinensis]|uniref:Beta-lactamase family protein n=1 Tax=Paenibacillus tianjinensis TaxID=2810347 RepID=A0ABX7L507_9BACL|nr:serine hydrolase domain-containing protein [Paenibacillus tianjinensis]QSF42998.1 beta-lactamase family protein [Paenibacillus tianjinensis]
MKKLLRRNRTILVSVVLLIVIIPTVVCWHQLGTLFTAGKYGSADEMVRTIMAKTATPGVAMVTSKQGKTDYKVYGYSDVDGQQKVTSETLFELGSATKAFTALAVVLLEEQGKLAYSDYVSEYLPEFVPTYRGGKAEISINQLMAHTSGIPSWTIKLIPEGTTADTLTQTIHKISDIALDTYPGTDYQYATINYDILAMIIEQVTGSSYQDFVTQNILIPLGMTDSYFSTGQEMKPDQLSKGYRVFFGKSLEYDAPRYYGNMAAGYLVTNLKDLEHWLNAQLGMGDVPDHLKQAIKQSHEADLETAGYEAEDLYYAYGWDNDPERRLISHTGMNPNFSSQVIIDLKQQEAVFVLANLNSTAPSLIAHNIYGSMNGNPMKPFNYDDSSILMDWVFSFLVLLAVISVIHKALKLMSGAGTSLHNERSRRRKRVGAGIHLIIRLLLLVLILIWPYLIHYDYYMISVWMSYSVIAWIGLAAISCVLAIILNLKRMAALRGR